MNELPKTNFDRQTAPPLDAAPSQQSGDAPRYDSASLFQGGRMVVISHAGESYRLLLTRNNRLILQK